MNSDDMITTVIWEGMGLEDINKLNTFGIKVSINIQVGKDWYGLLRGKKLDIIGYTKQEDGILILPVG